MTHPEPTREGLNRNVFAREWVVSVKRTDKPKPYFEYLTPRPRPFTERGWSADIAEAERFKTLDVAMMTARAYDAVAVEPSWFAKTVAQRFEL